MSIPPSVYIDDSTGTIYGASGYLNQLTLIGNTQQASLVGKPALMTPSIAAANYATYSYVANGLIAFNPLYNVVQDAAGRARLNNDTIVVGNLSATNYLNYPAYQLPSNVAFTSLTANLATTGNLVSNNVVTGNLVANTASIGLLTVSNLQGYTPPTQNLTGNTLNYTSANLQTVQGNNVTMTGLANLAQLTSQNANLQTVQASNVTVAGLANVANLRYGTAVGNALNVQSVTATTIQGPAPNVLSIFANSSNVQFENTFSLTAQTANCVNLVAQTFQTQVCVANTANVGTLYVANLQGYSPPVANTQNLVGNTLSYSTILAGNIGPLAQVGNVLSNLTISATGVNAQSLTGNNASVTTLLAGNIGPLAQVGNVLSILTISATGVNVQNLTGNNASVTTLLAGNIGPLAQVGNVLSNLTITATTAKIGQANVVSLGATTLFCSNIVGYSPVQTSLTDISGNSATYNAFKGTTLTVNTANVSTLLANVAVGILNPTPAYPLDVGGVVRAAANNSSTRPTALRIENLSTGPLGATLDMASQFSGLAQPNKIAGQMLAEPDSATGGRIVLSTSTTAGALTTAVNINAAQQVGINTSNPAYQLDVNGQARFITNQVWHQANAPGFYIGNALSTNQSGFLTFNNAGPPSGPGSLGLGVFGVGGLTVSGTGNVGIQASQPAYLFDVGGTGRIPTLLSSNVATSAVSIPGSGPLNFAYDNTTKDPNAGVIGYQRFSGSCLDIIGAGTGPPNRAVRVWETLGVGMNPSYPLDISGTGRIPTLLTGGGTISASNPYISVAGGGDLIGLKFSAAADRYGLALNGGVTRVITSGVNATAQVGLSLASTDGPGASATGFTDLLFASNSGVTVTRPFTAQTANVSTLFCSNIVGYSPAQAANLTNITGNSANYAQVTAGNVVVQGNVNAAAGSFTGNLTVQGSEAVNGSLSVYGSQGISQNLSVYGSQGLLVQSSSSTPVQLVSTNGGAGNPIGIGLSTFLGRGTPACQVVALDDGNASAHLLLSTANPGTSNSATERVRVTSSGNVGFNQSSPQYLVHAQPANTDVPAINPDAYNTLMVYEDCSRSTLAQGYLTGSASYTSGNGYVVLTAAATSLQGQLNYPINPGTAFDVTAEVFVGTAGNSTYPADGFSFFCFNNGSTTIDLYQSSVAQGYVLGFSDYASANVARGSTTPAYSVMLWYNGTLLASQSYTSYSVPLNTWTQLRISFIRNVWRVWLGTTQVINYQDISRTLVGSGTSFMGFNGQTGGYWASHLIRNIQITKHVQGPWRPATGGNVSGIQYNGVVNVAGNLAVTGTTVLGTAATDTSIGASAGIVNRVANVSYVLPNQGTTFTGSTGGTQSYVYTDYNYPSQTGSSPGGRMFINDSNYSTDFRWLSKAPGAFGNPLVERLTITSQGLVGINQSVPQYTCDVNGQLRTTGHTYIAGNAYITGPIVQNLGQDCGEFIYSRYSGGIGDRYGIGQWPGGKTRVFSSATYAPGFSALSIASTDTLGPSGSNFQDIVVASNAAVTINRPLTVAQAPGSTSFFQGTSYQNLFIGNAAATSQCGFLNWNNTVSPGYTNSLGIGVYGAAGGITCSPNGSVGISQSQPSASTSLDIYGPVRAQQNNVSQTWINSGGSYTISGGSALTNSTIWNAITFGNQNSTDVTSALWATNATFFTIPVNGVYHLSFDGTASASNTFAGYWTFAKLGGSSTNASNLKLGPSTCTTNLFLHSNFTMYLQAGDQPQFVFASGSTGSFATNGASVRIVLLNRC